MMFRMVTLALKTTKAAVDLLGGVTVIRGKAENGQDLALIPYYAWANRGQGQMAVWLTSKEPQVVIERKND